MNEIGREEEEKGERKKRKKNEAKDMDEIMNLAADQNKMRNRKEKEKPISADLLQCEKEQLIM